MSICFDELVPITSCEILNIFVQLTESDREGCLFWSLLHACMSNSHLGPLAHHLPNNSPYALRRLSWHSFVFASSLSFKSYLQIATYLYQTNNLGLLVNQWITISTRKRRSLASYLFLKVGRCHPKWWGGGKRPCFVFEQKKLGMKPAHSLLVHVISCCVWSCERYG